MLKKALLFLSMVSFSIASEINLDKLIKKYEEKLQTKKIIVSVLDNNTGKLVYVYNKNLASSYKFEPGSVFKPIFMAILLDNHVVKKDEQIFLHNEGKKDDKGMFPKSTYKIDKYNIIDSRKYSTNYFNYEEILKNSSNVGMVQLSQRLNNKQIKDGFNKYGVISANTLDSYIKKFQYDKDNLIKATYSYGQGFNTTFNELLNAYSILTNNNEIKKVISEYSGTSQIVENDKYVKKYVSSTFGFSNIKNKDYTIGVTVIEPISTGKYWYYYYSKYSSEPLFNEILNEIR